MIHLIWSDGETLNLTMEKSNNWLSDGQTRYKEEFRYKDMRYSSDSNDHSLDRIVHTFRNMMSLMLCQ